MEEILQTLATAPSELIGQYIGFLRYAVPVMTFLLLLRCAFPLLTFRREPEIWAWLNLTDGTQIPITHWENVIGRSKSCDVTIDFSTISRNHAVLTRYDDGSWTLLDIGSKTGTFVNDLDGVLREFDRVIGLNRLKALHLNDSKNPFASHKDRHECIGKGSLGLETFRAIVNHPALRDKPMILETPNELPGYQEEIALLRSLES